MSFLHINHSQWSHGFNKNNLVTPMVENLKILKGCYKELNDLRLYKFFEIDSELTRIILFMFFCGFSLIGD